ncbi:MAG TPA: hypothetical protein VJ742_11030 [Nitrososphaera sp.]|nr:hypothetical protein [Nitrososphaera sp.]
MLAPNPIHTRAKKILTSGFFLLVFGSFLSIMLTVAYASVGSKPQEQYIMLSTVGSDMTTKSIYPTSGPLVSEGDTLDWNVQLYNHMGESEYVEIRLKLLNSTQQGPDNVLHLPSPAAHIYEERIALASNETAVIPISIKIADAELARGDDTAIRSLTVNGAEITGLNVTNVKSNNFRFIIELWRHDVETESFVFTWPSGLERESAWNQIRIQVK